MKRDLRRAGWILASLVLSLTIVQCGGSGGGKSATVTVSIITPTVAQTVPVNGTLGITASVVGTTNTAVTWTVNGVVNGNSTYGTILGTGLSVTYLAPTLVPNVSSFNIRATSNQAPSQSASMIVTVSAGVLVSMITPTSGQNVVVSSSLIFAASLSGTSNTGVTWTVNGIPNGNATFGTIAGSGLSVIYNAPAAVPSPATFNVTVTSVADPTQSASVTIVISPGVVISITNPNGAQMVQVNSTVGFTATVAGTSNTNVTWSVNGVANGNSVFGTITGTGLSVTYNAPSAVPSPATFNVTVTSVADSTKSASVSVQIVPGVAVSITTPTSPQSFPVNSSFLFVAAVTGTSSTGVTWTVNGVVNGNSTYGTISGTGLSVIYNSPAAVPSPATFNVTATSVADITKSASVSVTITPLIVAVSITTPASPQTLQVNSALGFTAAVTGTSTTDVIWTVNGVTNGNPTYGTIAGTGLSVIYTSPAAVPSPATFNITATSVADGTKSASVSITIAAALPCESGHESFLSGQYAFQLKGFNNLGFGAVVGSITVDGLGHITAGEVDMNNTAAGSATHSTVSSAASSYSVGSDNRGCATIVTASGTTLNTRFDLEAGTSGVTEGQIMEFDPTSPGAFIATGQVFQQSGVAFVNLPGGGYVHLLTGWDSSNLGRIVCAGVHTNSGVNISNSEETCNDAGAVTQTGPTAGTVGSSIATDQFGRFTETETATSSALVAYFVSPSRIAGVPTALTLTTEVDGANTIVMAGQVSFQNSTAFSQSSLTGPYVIYGDGVNNATSGKIFFAHASADGIRTLTLDNYYENDGGTWVAEDTSQAYTYTVDSHGHVTLTPTGSSIATGHLYLTGSVAAYVGADSGGFAGFAQSQTGSGSLNNSSLLGTFFGGTTEIVNQTEPAENDLATLDGSGNVSVTFDDSSTISRQPNQSGSETVTIAPNGTISPAGQVTGIVINTRLFLVTNNPGSPYPSILLLRQNAPPI